MDTASEGIWIIDAEARTEYVNQRLAEMFGYSCEEMLNRCIYDFMDESVRSQAKQQIELRQQKIQQQFDFCYRRRDGSKLWVIVSTNPIFKHQGEIVGLLAMLTDISDRKSSEAALPIANQQLADILESITDAFLTLDTQWRITYMNRQCEKIAGYSREQLKQNIWDIFPQAVGSVFYEQYHKAVSEKIAVTVEAPSPLGSGRWLEARAYPWDNGLAIFFQDITERKQAQEALLDTPRPEVRGFFSRRLKTPRSPMTYAPPDRLQKHFSLTLMGCPTTNNKTYISGFQLISSSVLMYTSSTDKRAYIWTLDYIERLIRLYKIYHARPPGRGRLVSQFFGQSEESLRLVVESADLGMWDYNLVSGHIIWSQRSKTMFGLAPDADVTYEIFLNALHPEDRESFEQAVAQTVATGENFNQEYRILKPDGTLRWIAGLGRTYYNPNGEPTRMAGVMLDITDRQRIEARFRHIFESNMIGMNFWTTDGEIT